MAGNRRLTVAGNRAAMTIITRYLVEHWRGQMSLLWSFLVNGVAFYLVMVAALLGFNAVIESNSNRNPVIFWTLVALFGCGAVWSLGGMARASWKALRDPTVGIVKKSFAAILIAAVALLAVTVVSDVVRLALQR
jgi:hypothetical protein